MREAALSMERRLADQKQTYLPCKAILRVHMVKLGQKEEALRLRRDVYAGRLRLHGEEI